MKKRQTRPRALPPPIVAAVVQPVAKRLGRIEALLIEMRNEQDVQLKRIKRIEAHLENGVARAKKRASK